MKQYEKDLAGLTEHTNALRHAVIAEEDWALVANQLRSIEVDLGEKRREIEGDATEVAQVYRDAHPLGKATVYESDQGNLVEQRKRAYSFNSSGILLTVMIMTGDDIGKAIRVLIEANALELKWKVSYLENLADKLGLELRKAYHEIEDGDPDYLVGVVTTSKMARG